LSIINHKLMHHLSKIISQKPFTLPIPNKHILPTTLFATLFFLVIIISVSIFSCTTSRKAILEDKDGYKQIFDGKTLDGWEYDPAYWRVESGTLVGEVPWWEK
jgi:hypothetical protein